MASSFAPPLAVRLDPVSAGGRWCRQRKVKDRKRLAVATSPADRDDMFIAVLVDAFDGDRHPPRTQQRTELAGRSKKTALPSPSGRLPHRLASLLTTQSPSPLFEPGDTDATVGCRGLSSATSTRTTS